MFKKIINTVTVLSSFFFTHAQIAVKADTVFTVTGNTIANGVILIKDGKIEAVGSNLSIPNGYTTYTAKIVTPGLIDARSVVGFSGAYNVQIDQDQI